MSIERYGELESYSVREMPQIYELWCLVSLIQVLETVFKFKSTQSDIIALLASITPSKKKVEMYIPIRFEVGVANRSVVVHYQKLYRLNSRRPDIILEIKCNERRIFLVIDAKFKNYRTVNEAILDSCNMVSKYKEDDPNRFAFTVHPCFESDKKSALTNMGGKAIYIGDTSKIPFHNYGYLAAQPGRIEALRKVVSMAFEYLLESSHSAIKTQPDRIDPIPEFDLLCINCGNADFHIKSTEKIKNIPRYQYTYQ